MKWLVFVVSVCFAFSSAYAANWSKASLGCPSTGYAGVSTWSESASANSGMIEVQCGATCVNTGTTDWAVWSASCLTGTAENEYWSSQDGVTCGPTATTDDCGTVELPSGCWVFVPAATGADAECKASTPK